MKNIRLGDVLIEFGYITPDQLNTALAYQKEHRDLRVGQALQELGYVNERQVLEALAQRLQLTMIDIEHTNVDVTAVEKVPQELAQKYDMLPIAQSPRALTIAANDPLNYYALEDIRQLTGLEPEIVLAELEPLRRAIRYYYAEVSARKAARTANDSDMAAAQTEDLAIDMTAEGGDLDAPIIRLLNSLVQRAVTTTASDIHIEPFEGETKVRMRIDGVIIDYVTLQRALHQPLIARIKIMSNLDIAEHRIPQDGHFRARLETGPDVNVRVSILPTVFGEKAVLRILSSNTYIKNASHFGMNDETYKRFLPLLNRPNGIVYLTGPTGSGKTTTLYMVLQTIAERQVNVSTIEDPVERNLARINQTQVNNIAGLTFESGLRALLRQDPDVIMVGETRDAETASISVRAAITGHMVFSTLHTNDALSSIVRLEDMGVERYMIANSVAGLVAQRLMRRVCPHCAKQMPVTAEERTYLGPDIPFVRRGTGCTQCNGTGYRGRIAIHELVIINRELRELISAGATQAQLTEAVRRSQGMTSLREAALQLVREGETTPEELLKITFYEE
uniref:GspE/PulE family protein n=1 Tax=Gemmiger formicilis TaxID=745368 RepID=UPI004027BC7D